ncbi:MAG: hypothetical protein HY396_01240 [Candidatus Doudnabacteria bacterium]|nr:hypothetical protein [Candidatus Doudnabacteria bacterium]
MINFPKLPEKEELEFKEKEFFQTLYENFANTSKVWFWLLLIILIAAIPLKLVLEDGLAKYFIQNLQSSPVNTAPYRPQDLKIVKVQILPVVSGVYSVYAQIVNPNPDISVRRFNYQFVVSDKSGDVIKETGGQSYILAGESKFLLVASLTLAIPPAGATLKLTDINWTKARPQLEIKLEAVQQNSGKTPEGKFFVDGIIRNLQGFGFKKVEVGVLLFDSRNQNIVAVNSTTLSDLRQFESRYFRLVWPAVPSSRGQIQIIPSVNPLNPGIILEEPEKIPAR